MDPRSEANLAQVHPDLCRVIREAAQHAAFLVIHGIRTETQEAALVAKGASQTMHSRHLPNHEGFACAVDLAALDEGHVSWDEKLYGKLGNIVKAAALHLDVPVQWGGDWKTLKDLGHFQLPWAQYP